MTAVPAGDLPAIAAYGAHHDLLGPRAAAEWMQQTEEFRVNWRASADAAVMAAGVPKRITDGNTKLREENTRLRGRLQAVRQLAEQAAASGIVDSRALLAETEDL